MKALGLVLLGVCTISLMAACGQENRNASSGNSSPASAALPQDNRPTMTEEQRVATVTALYPTPTPTLAISPPPTEAAPKYDPGPYFTPLRSRPEDPITFVPAETVGEFTRYQVNGTCLSLQGQTSYYTNAENATIQFSCQFKANPQQAQTAIRDLSTSNAITGEVLLMKLQGEESFLLAPSGDGFLYAWTHGHWLFIARSPIGRAPLDNFMQALPY